MDDRKGQALLGQISGKAEALEDVTEGQERRLLAGVFA